MKFFLPVISIFLFWTLAAGAADGPGLGNLDYTPNELFQPVAIIESPRGHGNVAMVNGYLMVIYSSDGGGTTGDGGIEFWDVSNPRAPVLAVRHDDADTHGLREAHGFAFSNSYAGDYMVAQAVEGIQFWDLSDPYAIRLIDYMDLPGVGAGDYSGAWWTFWQAPYVYVAAQGSGLYVIDAGDPSAPRLVTRISSSLLGGTNPAMVYAIGNLLVIGTSQAQRYATLDISDPVQPQLLQIFNGRSGYSHLFAAGKLLSSGGNGDPARMYVHSIGHDGRIAFAGQAGAGLENGGYGSYQDGFFHSGFSAGYAKFAIDGFNQTGSGSSGLSDRDEDFAQVLGNLVFVGDDHGVGSALIVHQREPDTTGPEVHWIHPPDAAVGQALSTRIGVSMSDNIDIESVDRTTFSVRPSGGAPLRGKYSVQMGLVNFSPDRPLTADTEYEVAISGLRDWAGNRGGKWRSHFHTGAATTQTLLPSSSPPVPAATDLISRISFAGETGGTGVFAAGVGIYGDRTYIFTGTFPAPFQEQSYIVTRNDDKTTGTTDFLSFTLNRPATVYVLFDERATKLPGWLDDGSWTATGAVVGTTDKDVARIVYARDFAAGEVILGGNAAAPMADAQSMYSVLAIPAETVRARTTVPQCTLAAGAPVTVGTALTVSAEVSDTAALSNYRWDFGDGTPALNSADVPSVSHVYDQPGRYPLLLTVGNTLGSSTCSRVQIVHRPLTDYAPVHSASMIGAGAAYVFNVNPDNDTVSAIDRHSLSKVWETPVGRHPQTLAPAPDGNIWVVNRDDATIDVLATADGRHLASFSLPRASRPFAIAFNTRAGLAYVTLQASGKLLKLDIGGRILAELDVGPHPHGLAISGDGHRILVTQFIASDGHARVREIDADTFSLRRNFDLAFDHGPDNEAGARGLPNYLAAVVISPDGTEARLPAKKDNLARGLFRDGQTLNFESMVRTIVARLDLVDNHEELSTRLDLNDRSMAQSLIFGPSGDIFFVASQGSNRIEVYDSYTSQLLASLATGLAPQGMVLVAENDSARLFVHNYLSRSVSVFDVAGLLAGIGNDAPLLAEIGTVGKEKLASEVLKGKRIFYNAADPRMSRDGYLSCAACHLDGGSDGQVWDFTQTGEGLRNTISLHGRAGTAHGRLHWTANFDEIQDFEHDIRHFAGGRGFLDEAGFAATGNPLGKPKAGLSAELDALAAYVASLDRFPPSPYRSTDGTLSADAESGRRLFSVKGCARCHSGASFSDGQRHDVGTVQDSSGQGQGRPLAGTGFDTPTLLGVWNSAPYLHDGQAATLYEVLSNPAHTGQLSAAEQDRLVTYLLQLDGTAPDGTAAE